MLLAYGASEPLYSQKTVYDRPEGTLTLTLCVGERVAVPAACRLTNMKNQPQLQKAAVRAGGWGRTSSLRLSWLGGAPPVELHRHIRMFSLFFIFSGGPFQSTPALFPAPPLRS